jgi:hypothetical protein
MTTPYIKSARFWLDQLWNELANEKIDYEKVKRFHATVNLLMDAIYRESTKFLPFVGKPLNAPADQSEHNTLQNIKTNE